MELVCDTLHRYGLMRLLEKFAQQAFEQWPEHTVFVFHTLYAKANGMVFKLNNREYGRLDDAFDRARRDGDSRTAHRIMEFMEPPSPFGFSPGFPPELPHGFSPGLPQGSSAELAAIIDEIGPDALEALMEAMESDLGRLIDDTPLDNPRKPARVPKPKKRVANSKEPNPDQKELF